MNEEMKKLEELCLPIVEWLKKNYDPYTQVQITSDNIEMIQKVIGIPLEVSKSKETLQSIEDTLKRIEANLLNMQKPLNSEICGCAISHLENHD